MFYISAHKSGAWDHIYVKLWLHRVSWLNKICSIFVLQTNSYVIYLEEVCIVVCEMGV